MSFRLRVLDEMLSEFEAWSGGEALRGVLFAEENDLSPAQRLALATTVSQTRVVLEELRRDCGLTKERRSVRRMLLSRRALLHEALTELEPAHLRGYGAIETEAATYLGG